MQEKQKERICKITTEERELQEIQALDAIDEIIQKIGGYNTYAGIAFKGVLTMAYENIKRNSYSNMDFIIKSLQANVRCLQEENKSNHFVIDDLEKENKNLKNQIIKLKAMLFDSMIGLPEEIEIEEN